MKIKKHIPNLLTLGNLFSGTIAAILAVQEDFYTASIYVLLGILFDFFDGFVARLLNTSGELGKQLDSLADMVTSGVVPGIIMYKLIENNLFETPSYISSQNSVWSLSIIGLILTLGSCYRLAKFNIDTRQSNSFIGLPTPAMCLFIVSLPLIKKQTDFVFVQNLLNSNYFLIITTVLLTYLMNAELPLFSLKFKEYSIKNNIIKYLFLVISLLMIILFKYTSIPLIILSYVFLSVVNNLKKGN